jgi:hypothetical protein
MKNGCSRRWAGEGAAFADQKRMKKQPNLRSLQLPFIIIEDLGMADEWKDVFPD